MPSMLIRAAHPSDLADIKTIADKERKSLGFITRKTIETAIEHHQIIVATVDERVVGFQHYNHRKTDLQTTLYHKAVAAEYRGQGIGTALVDAIVQEARVLGRNKVVLKCPVDLASNEFHRKYGFRLAKQIDGKQRSLNVWEFFL